jgi:HAD superfamily hydrolase (TIGR01509 family)
MIKGVIFDMDGVLVDSEPLYKKVNRDMFEKIGFSVTEEEYSGFVGTTDVEMWTKLKKRFGIDKSIEELNTICETEHTAFFENIELKPMKGLIAILAFLKDKGIKLVVASSTDEKLVHLILSKIGIINYFENIVCGNHIENGKPEPDIFLKAAELSGLKSFNCLVIEDSKNGVRAGKKAGMTVMGFQSDDGTQDLSAADILVFSLKEAMEYLKGIL